MPLGSDYLGRDVFAGILTGGRTTLAVCSVAALITVFIGVPIGALGGFPTAAGSIAPQMMRFTEFFQVLPSLLFAMVLVALFKPSLVTVTIAISVVNWTSTARIARGEFLRLRHMDFVRASRACGATRRANRLARNYTQRFAAAHRLRDAFCGRCHPVRGRFELPRTCQRPDAMTWGIIIGSNRNAILTAWWAATIPGMVMFLTVLSITLVGDGLNDALNPKLRER